MRRHQLICPLLIAAVFVVTGSRLVAEETTEPAIQQSELARINGSLQQLVSLLEAQVRNQRTQLAVQRLDVARREVIARERELHEAEVSRDSYTSEEESIETRLETLEGDLEDSGISELELEEILRQAVVQRKSVEQRLWRLDQRILDLRSELARAREDLVIWEEMVAETL